MNTTKKILITILLSGYLLPTGLTWGDTIRVAVASNFSNTIRELSRQFEIQSKHQVSLVFGATGKHYAQIRHGAPFDIFFAADSQRPQLLEKENLIIPNSRYTYALGKLVLWSPDKSYVDAQGNVLSRQKFDYLAIANPRLAPYGKAAQEVLARQHLWSKLKRKIVRGENIAQTFQYVNSGNAQLGFVALSQINTQTGSYWVVPDNLYSPIEQQAVQLSNKEAASEFYAFVKSRESIKLIQKHGYGTL